MESQQTLIEIQALVDQITRAIYFGRTQEQKINVFILADQSGSITSDNYDLMRMCMWNLCELFEYTESEQSSPTKIGFISFSDNAILEAKLTCERLQVIQKIKTTTYANQSTNTHAALCLAEQQFLLEKSIRPDAKNIIFLFTDDNLHGSSQKAGPKFKTLIDQMDIRIITIFMKYKPPSSDILKKEFSLKTQFVIVFSEFKEMQLVFDQLLQAKKQQATPYKRISKGPTFLEIEMQELKNSQIEKYEFEILEINLQNQFVSWQNKSQRFDAHLPCFRIDGLPQKKELYMKYRGILRTGLPTEYHMFDTKDGKKMHFKFTISDPLQNIRETFQKDSKEVQEDNEIQLKKFLKYEIPENFRDFGVERLNVLILGLMGSGKSSLINTFMSVQNHIYKNIRETGNGTQTLTKEISRMDIYNSQTINVLDSWGIEFPDKSLDSSKQNVANSNYAECLKPLLKGNIGPGFNLEYFKNPQSAKGGSLYKQDTETDINEVIHAVLLVVSITIIHDQTLCIPIANFIEEITKISGITPIIILTKADLLVEQLTGIKNPPMKDIINVHYKHLESYITKFRENINFKVEEQNILVLANILSNFKPEHEDHYVNQMSIYLQNNLIQNAESFLEKQFLNHYRVVIENFQKKDEVVIDYNAGFIIENNDGKLLQDLRANVLKVLKSNKKIKGQLDSGNTFFFVDKKLEPVEDDDEGKKKLNNIIVSVEVGLKKQKAIRIHLGPISYQDNSPINKPPQNKKYIDVEEIKNNDGQKLEVIFSLQADQQILEDMAKEIQFNFTLTKIKDLLKEDCPKINLDEFEFLDKQQNPIQDESSKYEKYFNNVLEVKLQKKQKDIVIFTNGNGDDTILEIKLSTSLFDARILLAKEIGLKEDDKFQKKHGDRFVNVGKADESKKTLRDIIYKDKEDILVKLKMNQ